LLGGRWLLGWWWGWWGGGWRAWGEGRAGCLGTHARPSSSTSRADGHGHGPGLRGAVRGVRLDQRGGHQAGVGQDDAQVSGSSRAGAMFGVRTVCERARICFFLCVLWCFVVPCGASIASIASPIHPTPPFTSLFPPLITPSPPQHHGHLPAGALRAGGGLRGRGGHQHDQLRDWGGPGHVAAAAHGRGVLHAGCVRPCGPLPASLGLGWQGRRGCRAGTGGLLGLREGGGGGKGPCPCPCPYPCPAPSPAPCPLPPCPPHRPPRSCCVAGGYSYRAVKPIALAKVMNIAQMLRRFAPWGEGGVGWGGGSSWAVGVALQPVSSFPCCQRG
jgi:hypothetical protein